MKYESFIYYFRIILIESINDNKELGITYMLKPNFIKIQNFINIILKKKELSYEKSKSLITQFQVLNNINPDETEENQKTLIRDFLKNTFGYKINTSGDIDWAIFNEETTAN